jgi:hypothetical protein
MRKQSQIVTLEQLAEVPLPKVTDTYMPVPFEASSALIREMAQDYMEPKGYHIQSQQLKLSANQKQMFGKIIMQDGLETGFTIGWMNSYDKSTGFKVATGATVMVCENLTIAGEVMRIRKHTPKVWSDLERILEEVLMHGRRCHENVEIDMRRLSQIHIDDGQAFTLMFEGLEQKIIRQRMLLPLYYEWKEPRHKEFEPRTAWSLYNGFTQVMKNLPERETLDQHANLHQMMMEVVR